MSRQERIVDYTKCSVQVLAAKLVLLEDKCAEKRRPKPDRPDLRGQIAGLEAKCKRLEQEFLEANMRLFIMEQERDSCLRTLSRIRELAGPENA